MTDTDLREVRDPRLAEPDLTDDEMAKLLNIPVNRLIEGLRAEVYVCHMRGTGPRKARRYTPQDIYHNRELADRGERRADVELQPSPGIPAPASIPEQRLVRAATLLKAAGSRSTSTA